MAGRICVVYAQAATGLKLWPIAVFCNSDTAAADARAYATAAVAEGKRFRAGTGAHPVARTEVREYATWARVPALSKGF
jgi:hypothetical protein